MFQRIDVIIYNVMMDRGTVGCKTIRESQVCVVTVQPGGCLQTLGLGMVRMIAGNFA